MIEAIPGYESGSNVILLNVLYDRPKTVVGKDGKPIYTKGTLYEVYRDLDTGEKKMVKIDNPMTHTYITKPELRKSFNTQRQYMKLEDVDSYEIPYKDMTKFLYQKIKEDGVDTYYSDVYEDAIRLKKHRMKNMVFRWRHSYYADYDICDYYTTHSLLQYKPKKFELTKAFADIETDVYQRTQEEHNNGECPIIALSIVLTHSPNYEKLEKPLVLCLFLRNHNKYKQQIEVEENLDKFIQECHGEFDKKHGVCDYKIIFFDDEVEMISNYFGIIHMFKPDFCHFWNMSYDIPYIIKRLRYHGYNPNEFFNHQDFGLDHMPYYYTDMIPKKTGNNSDRVDYFDCASYTKYIDQMLNYAGIRKGRSDYGGDSLDNVSKLEIGAEKRVYDGAGVDVINGPVYEYWNFAKYAVNDVLLQYSIDIKTNDTYVLFDQAYYGGCSVNRTLKQSKYLRCVYDVSYFELGLVQHNNLNIDYTANFYSDSEVTDGTSETVEKVDGYEGALVGKPDLNYPNGVEIFGKGSRYRYKLTIDFDYSSMYPNGKIKFNVSPHTQYFRIDIPKPILANDNPLNEKLYLRGGKFVDDLIVGDMNKLGKWFNLPTITELAEEFDKEDVS